MKKTTFILFIILSVLHGHAQEFDRGKPENLTDWRRESIEIAKSAMQDQGKYELKIDDILPATDVLLINGPHRMLNTRQLRGKYAILSFWNTSCATCIAAFPKLEQLQKNYSDRLTILPVTYEIEPLVERTLTKQAERGFPFGLPMVIRDSTLRKYFPHQGDPYEVWIDPDGRLLAVTDGDAVTERAVQQLIDQGIPPTNTHRYPFDPNRKTSMSREEYLEWQKSRGKP